jgi:hypothetical protein
MSMGKATVRVKLASMTPKDISAGLVQLAARIKEGVLGFSVAAPKKSHSELAFYKALVERT